MLSGVVRPDVVLSGVVLPDVVLLGAGALRCGACGCWCSWEIKRLKSHSPAIQYFDNGTSLHSIGTGYIRRYGGKVRCDEGGRKVRCDDGGGKVRSDVHGGKVRSDEGGGKVRVMRVVGR